jgi:hypothetical protein
MAGDHSRRTKIGRVHNGPLSARGDRRRIRPGSRPAVPTELLINEIFQNRQNHAHSQTIPNQNVAGKNSAAISARGGPAPTSAANLSPHPRHPRPRRTREPPHSIAGAAPGRRPRRCRRPDRAAGARALAGIETMRGLVARPWTHQRASQALPNGPIVCRYGKETAPNVSNIKGCITPA